MELQRRAKNPLVSMAVVFILVNGLGFPGNYTLVFGPSLGTLVEYGAFLLQFALMIFTSANNVMDVRILNFHSRYTSIYVLLATFFFASILGTSNLSLQLVTCIRLCVTALFAIWMSEYYEVDEVLRHLYWAQIIFVIFTLIFVTVFRSYKPTGSYENDFVGLFDAKNGAGAEVCFCLLMMFVQYRVYTEKKLPLPRFWLLMIWVQFVLMVLSHNVGSTVSLVLPSIYLFFFEKNHGVRGRLHLGHIFIILSIGFILVALTILPLFEPLLEQFGKDATLTGRVPLWQQSLSIISSHKTLTGFGYGMFWRDQDAMDLIHMGFDRTSYMGNITSGSHNLLIEMWLNVGLIGIAGLFFAMLRATRRVSEVDEDAYLFSSCYLLFFTLFGLYERTLEAYGVKTLFLFISLAYMERCRIVPEPKRWHRREMNTSEDESPETEASPAG